MKNTKNYKIMPNYLFWEAVFSSFQKINQLSKYFTELKQEPNNENFPLSKLFYDFLNNKIILKKIPEFFKNIIISKNRQDLLLNPRLLFNFLLEELHNELIQSENKTIKRENINRISNKMEKAEELFDKYEKNNKSFIQKLFFGRKQIRKICQGCKSTTYELDFLKFCPINIQYVKGFVEIEKLYENIQREFEKIIFCKICNKNEKCKIKIDIVNEPKILILFIFNHTNKNKIAFSETFNEDYKIRSIIMEKESLLNNFFCSKNNKQFISYGKDKNKYFKFEKGDIKDITKKEFYKGNPYIIFYTKKEEKEENQYYEEINLNFDLGSKEILNKGRNNIKSNNKMKTERQKRININDIPNIDPSNSKTVKYNINKISKSTLDSNNINNNDKKFKNISLISHDSVNVSNDKNNIDANNNNLGNMDGNGGEENEIIRLYFKFEEGNIIFIDVENYMTFEKIIIKINQLYESANIDVDDLYFDDKQIEKNDTPKKLGILNGDYINVFNTLVD